MPKFLLQRKTICYDFCTIEAKTKQEAIDKVWDNLDWNHQSKKQFKWTAKKLPEPK